MNKAVIKFRNHLSLLLIKEKVNNLDNTFPIVEIEMNDLIKDALSGLKQFMATESSLKMMKNAFCFTLEGLFVLKIFKFLS